MFGRVRRGDALDVLSSKEKHGTHVAGIIAANGDVKGVNPHARIVGVRVTLPDPGSSTGESVYTSGIVRGLGWMVEAKRDYSVNIEGFNLSIAGPTGVTYAARCVQARRGERHRWVRRGGQLRRQRRREREPPVRRAAGQHRGGRLR